MQARKLKLPNFLQPVLSAIQAVEQWHESAGPGQWAMLGRCGCAYGSYEVGGSAVVGKCHEGAVEHANLCLFHPSSLILLQVASTTQTCWWWAWMACTPTALCRTALSTSQAAHPACISAVSAGARWVKQARVSTGLRQWGIHVLCSRGCQVLSCS